MFNVAVFKLKDIVKYFLTLISIIIIIILIKRYFSEFDFKNIKIEQKISSNISSYVQKAIELELPEVNQIYEQNNNANGSQEQMIDENLENADEEFMTQFFNTMLSLELGVINAEEQNKDNLVQKSSDDENNASSTNSDIEKRTEPENVQENVQDEELILAEQNVTTQVVTKNPLADSYTIKYKGVKIKNETDFNLTDDILNPEGLSVNKSNVIVFHTHTCESYTSSEKYSYTPTGNFRTTDLNYSVARVGDELTNYLTKYGINVLHDKTYHDYPSYSGSYTRSLSTVSNLLKNTSSDIIIDLHRDAIGSYSSYAPTVKIGEDYCAQLMFVIGTNGGGLNHPNWKSNLQFAIKLQEIANKLYPGLFKPIIVRNSRYNQHLSKAACIIEVGSTGNTLEQCLNSMKYLSEVTNQF